MYFILNLVVFAICAIIQLRALNRRAFGRSMFITIAMFFFSLVVFLAPDAPKWFVWLIFIITWLYYLYMTGYAITRLRKR